MSNLWIKCFIEKVKIDSKVKANVHNETGHELNGHSILEIEQLFDEKIWKSFNENVGN